METVRHMLMSYLVKLLVPESPAYGNTLPFVKAESLQDTIGDLEVCDIIFTKTNSSWYELCRRFLGISYDHVSVVINKYEVIHISPPIISKLDLTSILSPSRSPLILRLPLLATQKQSILSILQNFIGEKYNESAIPTMFKNELISRLFEAQKEHEFAFQGLKYSKICTEAILYAFGKGVQGVRDGIGGFVGQRTRYRRLGFLMPDQVLAFMEIQGGRVVFKSPPAPQPTYLQKIQHSLSTLAQKLPLTHLPLALTNSQILSTVSQLGKRTSSYILREHPLIKILNLAILVYELKYGNKFSKILFVETVLAVLMMLRVGPDEDMLRGMFRRLAKL